MANNGGRQGNAGGGGGGGGGGGQMNEHVEFTVKAEEDLYLEGSENTIRRVTAETNYSCLMLKTQRFSSLFRHYAKYHGLRKDDLEYYFVNPLENEDTPESVQLQRGDTIMVRRRRKAEPPEPAADDGEFFADMRELLDDAEHMDAAFVCHEDGGTTPASASGSGLGVCGTPPRPSPVVSSSSSSGGAGGLGMGMGGGGGAGELFGGSSSSGVAIKREDGGAAAAATSSATEMSIDEEDAALGGRRGRGRGTSSSSKPPAASAAPAEERMVEIRAHKCILTARAEYFKALFRKNAFRESEGGKIRVDRCFSPETVRRMLEFVYCNRISSIGDCSTQELLDLLHISNRWMLRDLKRLCEHELMKLMDVDNVARMYCATEEYNAARLAKACIDFIMENLRDVTGNISFQEEMRHYPHLCIPVLKAAADLIPEPANKKQRTGDPACSSPVPSDP